MKLLTFITLVFVNLTVFSAELKIEPVYGFERTFQKYPAPGRYKTETFIGIRALYGTPVIAGEAEINQSNNSYDVGSTETKTQTQKLLLGLRLVPISSELYSLYMRGGIRAQKIDRELTTAGETTDSDTPLNIDPYAGAGISLHVGSLFSLNTSATLVYNKDAEDSEKFDTRYTFSASIKFGSGSTSFGTTY